MSLAGFIPGLFVSVILCGHSSVVGSCYMCGAQMGSGNFTVMVFDTNSKHICW